MKTPLKRKASLDEIRNRFDNDVERFTNLETGQQNSIDAPLVMELITQAAVARTPHAKKILDIGCGAGNNTLRLLQLINPLDCDLIDLSKPMLDRARGRISAVNAGTIHTFQQDIRTVVLPAGQYDIIVAAAVLHHLRDDADWENTFSKIYELTAPGGSFWITDLVSHENAEVRKMMWDRYGSYLESIGGIEYRKKVFDYVDKEDSPRPITFQLELLRKVGFSKVDILHKRVCCAAFGAVKSG
jgi:tRNA (cmo5U34)-methyltransferase